MGDPVLVTSGNDFRIWETSTYSQIYSYTPEEPGLHSSIFSTSWSADTTGLASILKDAEDKILLTYHKNQKYFSHEIKTSGVSNPSYVQFPRTSQKHLYLSTKNELHFFDVARLKSRKSFTLGSDISCFTPNQTDSYIAIGCDNGGIVLLTTASNQMSQPFTAPKCAGQRVTCVKYSPRRAGFLGASCESGTLSFWDCNANKNLFNINDHLAPCTSFSFSPVNDSLAISCGLDKKLICHDTKSRKSVFSLVLEQPCTVVDFDIDGTTVAVGTSRGKVVVYDLRNTSHYTMSIQAHSKKVSSLSYRPRIDKINVNQVMSAVKSTSKSKLRSQKSVSALKTVEEESKENIKPETEKTSAKFSTEDAANILSPAISDSSFVSRRDSLSSQLFSPLKETDISLPGFTPNPSRNNSGRVSEVRLSTDGLFSPLREEGNTSLNLGRRTPFSNLGTPAMSPLTCIQEESSSPQETSPSKPVLSSNAFDINKPVSHGKVEKLSLETLTQVARSLTCRGEGSPEFDARLAEMDTPEAVKVEEFFPEETEEERLKSLVKPLGSSLCVIRDEDRKKMSSEEELNKNTVFTTVESTPVDVRKSDETSLGGQQRKADETSVRSQGRNVARELENFGQEQLEIGKEMHSVMTAFPAAAWEDDSSNYYSRLPHRRKSSAHLVQFPGGSSTDSRVNTSSGTNSSSGEGVAGFNRRYVEEVVSEAMEEWCSSVETRIVNMHYSLIRIMQQHQEETRVFIEEMNGVEALRRENERLRKENQDLKRFF